MELKILKKILPNSYTLNTAEKPMHAGEIFHLWDALTSSYQIINIGETYQMNTQDEEIHIFLKGLVEGVLLLRIPKLENLLRDAGFTVPPRPATKTLQGKPGVGQEVRLSDEEVLKVMLTLSHALLVLDARGVGTATTNEAIRGVFIDLLKKTILAHDALMLFGSGRQAFTPAPPATASPGALNLGEVYLSGRRRRTPSALASVRRSNRTCGFPASGFQEDVQVREERIEGMRETRLTRP